jgi:hypothetical protein
VKGIRFDERGRAFSTEQAPGAWPNGSRVIKVTLEPGDRHKIGDLATVVGSLSTHGAFGSRFAYFVIWDDMPGAPVFTIDKKLGLASRGGGDA